MFKIKKIFFVFLLLTFLFSFLYSATETFVIVNSKDWKDVIVGGIYAAQNSYSYLFILTQEQADYISSFFRESKNPFYYFESSNPVDTILINKLSSSEQGKIEKQSNLAEFFSKKTSANGAVIVGSDFGFEAVSAAPYAVFKNWSFIFATKDNIKDLVKNLKSDGKEILVYGSIANELPKDIFVDKIINTGSGYLDNLELLKLFESQTEIVQVVFASGKTYEPFITEGYPVVLIGRTEPTKNLIDWLVAHPNIKGVTFSGDEDISGALQSIKKETSISIFNKFGTGFSKDAKVKPNLVLVLPSRNVILTLEPPIYSSSSSSLKLRVNNTGNVSAYVQLVIELPNGKFIGSEKKEIKASSSYLFDLPISSDGLLNEIEKVKIHVYSSAEKDFVESVDLVEFLKVLIEPKSSTTSQSFNVSKKQIYTSYDNNYFPLKSTQEPFVYNWFFAIVILIIVVVIYLQSKNKFKKTKKENKKDGKKE